MRTALWILTIVGSILGAFIAIVGVVNANGAPQEASASAMGVACAVIPYCLARSWSEVGKLDDKRLPFSLTPCPECGNGISLDARMCPHCKKPLEGLSSKQSHQ
jgi:hypothetical protein